MSHIEEFIGELSKNQSIEILTDEKILKKYIAENYSRKEVFAPSAIIYPTTVEQVEIALKLANETKVSITVRSSSGQDSLTGTSLPWVKDSVVLNLSKMNKIIHVDTLNDMAVIEAGVTFEQLNKELNKVGYYMEHPLQVKHGKSIIAALIDRDPVLTAKHLWDVPDPLCAMKMVFGNGRLFGSGSAAGPGTLEEMLEAGCAMNQAQGPVWLDLGRVITGAQGTLAVCCWASVKIKKLGSCKKCVFVQSDDINKLGEYASMVIRRRLGEEAVLLNRKGMQQIFGLDAKDTAKMPKWTFCSTVRGYNYFPEEYMNNQFADMEDIAKEYKLDFSDSLNGLDEKDAIKAFEGTSKKNDFWKYKDGKEIVDLFCLNTIDVIEKFTKIAEKVVEKINLSVDDLVVYAQPSQMARNCHIEFVIQAGDKAKDLEMILGTALLDNNAFFSRPYGVMEEKVYNKYTAQRHFMPAIKKFFDEQGILNPGKLANGYKGGEI